MIDSRGSTRRWFGMHWTVGRSLAALAAVCLVFPAAPALANGMMDPPPPSSGTSAPPSGSTGTQGGTQPSTPQAGHNGTDGTTTGTAGAAGSGSTPKVSVTPSKPYVPKTSAPVDSGYSPRTYSNPNPVPVDDSAPAVEAPKFNPTASLAADPNKKPPPIGQGTAEPAASNVSVPVGGFKASLPPLVLMLLGLGMLFFVSSSPLGVAKGSGSATVVGTPQATTGDSGGATAQASSTNMGSTGEAQADAVASPQATTGDSGGATAQTSSTNPGATGATPTAD